MVTKTALDLVNGVYINLREEQVDSFADEYSTLLLQYVNQAKKQVEDAWAWHTFRKDITWASQADVQSYDLTDNVGGGGDADNSSELWLAGRSYPVHDPYGRILAWDTTTANQAFRLTQVPYWYGVNEQINSSSVDKPHQFYATPTGVSFVRAPNSASRTYKLKAIIPQDELTTTAEELTLPYWSPIVTLATAWAVNERGEEVGNRPLLPQSVMVVDWALQAERDLAEAISRDSSLDMTELVMDAGQIPYTGGQV